jgi:hypothetical protein
MQEENEIQEGWGSDLDNSAEDVFWLQKYPGSRDLPQETWDEAPAWHPCKFKDDIKYQYRPMVYSVLAENAVDALKPKPEEAVCKRIIDDWRKQAVAKKLVEWLDLPDNEGLKKVALELADTNPLQVNTGKESSVASEAGSKSKRGRPKKGDIYAP